MTILFEAVNNGKNDIASNGRQPVQRLGPLISPSLVMNQHAMWILVATGERDPWRVQDADRHDSAWFRYLYEHDRPKYWREVRDPKERADDRLCQFEGGIAENTITAYQRNMHYAGWLIDEPSDVMALIAADMARAVHGIVHRPDREQPLVDSAYWGSNIPDQPLTYEEIRHWTRHLDDFLFPGALDITSRPYTGRPLPIRDLVNRAFGADPVANHWIVAAACDCGHSRRVLEHELRAIVDEKSSLSATAAGGLSEIKNYGFWAAQRARLARNAGVTCVCRPANKSKTHK